MGLIDRDRFESTDGSRPSSTPLSEERARRLPLSAFAVLKGGDAFDAVAAAPDGLSQRARCYCDTKLLFDKRVSATSMAKVRRDATVVFSGNPQLLARIEEQKPLRVDIIEPGGSLHAAGYPPSTNERCAGLFWDHPSWPEARLAFRSEHLIEETLVAHELAHAVHFIACTKAERALIDGVLQPAFVDRQSIDEAFAIYSEREFCRDFTALERGAPGIYGFVRRQWHEDHVFTRFIRKLWWPHRPLAGPKLAPASWKRFLG